MTVDVGTAVRIALGLLEGVERDPLLAIHSHTTYLLRTRLKDVNIPTSNKQVELCRDVKPKGPLKEGGSDVIAGPGGVTLVVPERSHGDTHKDQTYRTAHVAGADNPGHSQLHSNSHTTSTYGGGRVGDGAPLGPPSGDGTNELHSSKSAHARSHSPTAAYNGGGRALESRDTDRERGRDRDRDRDRDRERRRSSLQSRDGSGYRTGLRIEHQESTRSNERSRERSRSRGRSRSRERSRSRSRAESNTRTPLSKRTCYDSEDTHTPTPSHPYAREQTRRSSTDEHSRGRDSHRYHVHRPQQDAGAAEGTRSRSTRTPSRDGRQSREGARAHSRTAIHTPTASVEDIRESLRVGMRSHAHAQAQTQTRTHTHHAEHTDLGYDRRDSTDSTGSSTRHHERRYTGARANPPGIRSLSLTHTERSTRVSRVPRVDPPSRSHSRTDSRSHSRTRNRADTPTVRGSSRASSRSGHHEGPVREDKRADTPTHHNTRTHTPTSMHHGRGGGLRAHTPTTTEHGPHSHVRTLEEMRRLARETVRGETWLDGDAQLDRKVQYLREAAEKLQRHSDDRDRDRDTARESEREEAMRVQAHVAVDPRVYGPYGRDEMHMHTHAHVPTNVHVHRPQEDSEPLTSARSSSGTRAIDTHRDPHRDARKHGGGKMGGRKSAVRVMRRVSDSTAEEGEPHVRRRHERTRREGDEGENRPGVISTGDGIRAGGAHRREARKKERTRKSVVLVAPYTHTPVHATSEPQVYSGSGAEEMMRGHRHGDTVDTTHTAHTHTHTHTHAPTSHDTHTHTGKAHDTRTHTTQPRSSAESGGGGHSDTITPTQKSQRLPKDVLEYIAASQSALNEPASTDTDGIPTRTREQASTRHMSDNEILAYSPPLPRTPTAERVNFSKYDEGLTDAYRRVSSQVGGDMQTHTHTRARTHAQKPTLVHLPSHVSVHTPTELTPQRTTFSHAPAITLTPAPRPLQRPPRDPSHTPARTRARTRGYEEPAPTVTAHTKDNRNSRDSRGNRDMRHTAPPSQYASMTSWTFTDAEGMSTERIRALAVTLPNITHINTVHVRGWDEALYAAVLDNWPLLTDWDLGIFPAVSDSGRLLTCLSQSAVEVLSVDGEVPSTLHSPVLRVLSAHETVSLRLLLAGNPALVELTLSWQVVSERLVSLSLQVLRVKQVLNPGALIGCPNLTELGVDSLTEKTFCTSAAVLSVTCHKVSNANMDRFPRVHTLRLGRYASLEEGFISRRVARLEMDSESESGLPLKYYLPMLDTLSCGVHDMRALSFMSLTTLTLRCFVDENALKQTIASCPCLESIYLREYVPWTYKPYSSVDLWQVYAETKLSRYSVTLFVDRSYESSASQGFLSLLREGRVGYTGL